MPVINVQRPFAPLIMQGTMKHVLRLSHGDNRDPRPKQTAQLWVGFRTKGARKLTDATILEVRPIELVVPYNGARIRVQIDGHRLPTKYHKEFAVNDGFKSVAAMCDFFREDYGGDSREEHNEYLRPFRGLLIQWHATRY